MPPVRTSSGRASKACDLCRARKQRCYESGEASKACLRCSTLKVSCSLQKQAHPPSMERHSCGGMEERIIHLEKTVERLSSAIGDSARQSDIRQATAYENEERNDYGAPLVVIQDAARDTGLNRWGSDGSEEAEFDGLDGTLTKRDEPSVISKAIIGELEVENLLRIFQRHYGRWIAVHETGTESFKLDNIKSSLLLCSCCLIALRHSVDQDASSVAPALFTEARHLLAHSLLEAPQSFEFFQAALILSLWPTTAGGKLLSMDPWLLTGFALQHGAISKAFGPYQSSGRFQTNSIRNLKVWNHLCLSHLHVCVSMRRIAKISKHDIERGRQVVETDDATNFEIRMYAEIYLYWTIYENCISKSVNLPQAQSNLKAWKDEWYFLFEQSRPQFLHMSFYFSQLIMYEQSLNNKSAAVRESLLSEMVRLASTLLNLAMETSDERTKYLTDHIFHMIAFAAVTLSRLLYRYEDQLSPRHNFKETDELIWSTIRWLSGIGMTSHIGHMMANVIRAMQQKLRPVPDESMVDEGPAPIQAEDLIVPEFLGLDAVDFDWDAIIPDWQSLASDEFLSPVQIT